MSFKRDESSAILKDNKAVVEILKNQLKSENIAQEEYNNVEVKELEKNSILITVVSLPSSIFLCRSMKKEKAALIQKIEEAINGTVFIIRGRVTKEVEGRAGKKVVKSSVSYADYQELVAGDLVSPSVLVDRRTVVREDGSRIEKMMIDLKYEQELVNRLEPMGIVFEDLFGRKAVFQTNYY